MKVVITNTAMCNGGDAAICFAIMAVVRETFGHDTKFTLVDPLANVARRYHPEIEILQAPAFGSSLPRPLRRLTRSINRLRIPRLRIAERLKVLGAWFSDLLVGPRERRVLRAYRDADLIISTGGTYLVDHYDISPRLFDLELALYAGKRPVFYTQSLGPFQAPGRADAVKPYFDRSPLILLRDEKSRGHLTTLGIAASKMHVLADSVFAIARQDTLSAAKTAPAQIRRVAISVRQWPFFQGEESESGMSRYISAVARAAEWLLRSHDCEVTFISTCQGIPEYPYKDSLVADQVVAQISDASLFRRVRVNGDFHSPLELQEILSQFDLVIATRMHMAILALCAGVPVFPIAYEFKTTELFARLGMGNWVLPIESAADDKLVAMLDDFLRNLPERRRSLFEAVEKERELALSAGELLSASVNGPLRSVPASSSAGSKAPVGSYHA
jgi:colanic acid/amylovoran biosynthesis protein